MKDIIKTILHPRELFITTTTDPYKSLKIRVVLLDAILSLLPLFIVITISYFWFQSILKEDYRSQMKWQIENTSQSLDFFLESVEKLVAQKYPGELKINVVGGPEVVKINDQVQAAQTGMVDIVHTTSAYYVHLLAEDSTR